MTFVKVWRNWKKNTYNLGQQLMISKKLTSGVIFVDNDVCKNIMIFFIYECFASGFSYCYKFL